MDSSDKSFIRRENIKNFKKRLEAATDDAQRRTLLQLLAEEESKAWRGVDEPETNENARLATPKDCRLWTR